MKPMHPDDTHQREENRARPARAMWHPAASLLNVGLAAALVTSACTSAPAATTPSAAPAASANAPSAAAGDPLACATTQGETIAIADAKLIIEYNSTDDDIGVHGAFDDHGWSGLCVYDPSGALALAVKPQGQLQDLTMAGIFFESREPPGSEYSFADLKAAFPEGRYEVRGTNFDGTGLAGFATFTHDVPAPPVITFPALAPDEESAGDAAVPAADLVIAWQDVTETVDGGPVKITGYEVIVTKVAHEDPHGFSQPIADVHLPPDRNTLTVSPEFLEPGTVYELEILALEESGNQTITTGFFKTE